MRLLLIAALCLLAAACTATATAPLNPGTPDGIVVDLEAVPNAESTVRIVEAVETQYYAVNGDTASAVRASLNESGPFSPVDGRIYDAITHWGAQWSFRYANEAGVCSLQSATIEVVAVIVLPELSASSRLGGQMLARWQAYLQALAGHEQGHVESVQRGVRALQAAMDASPAMHTCGELGAYLNALGNGYLKAMKAVDVEYDSETGHGKSQGAVFP